MNIEWKESCCGKAKRGYATGDGGDGESVHDDRHVPIHHS
jgi:hypothetical protein